MEIWEMIVYTIALVVCVVSGFGFGYEVAETKQWKLFVLAMLWGGSAITALLIKLLS